MAGKAKSATITEATSAGASEREMFRLKPRSKLTPLVPRANQTEKRQARFNRVKLDGKRRP
ncbi:hypothetical protein BLX87_13410 [Bacillus sp. VT-16-64]|nr:hypothetical protein BLX87_13410 [Bacillus sp. VT-16-64]